MFHQVYSISFPEWFIVSHSQFELLIFSFPEFQDLIIIPKIYLTIARVQLVFSTSPSFRFDHLFVTGVLHGSSTWWFIKDLYFFSKCSSRFFSKKLKHSSSCYPECNFFLPYLWRWYYVLLDNSPSLLRESQVIKNEIF